MLTVYIMLTVLLFMVNNRPLCVLELMRRGGTHPHPAPYKQEQQMDEEIC